MTQEDDQGADASAPVQAARDDWQDTTTALERVHQVVEQTTTPKTAGDIAEEALVSEPTARKHLTTLVEIGAATATDDPDATKYARNEDTLLTKRIQTLATTHSPDELLARIRRMKTEIRDLEEKHDATSPEDLVTSLEEGVSAEAWEDIANWQTAERNLHIAQAALNYGRARDLGAASH